MRDKKGFSIILVIVVLSSTVIIFSVILTFAVRSYRLQKERGERTQLFFAARSGIAVSLKNLSKVNKKSYTGIKDLYEMEESFVLSGFQIQTYIQDENAKLHIKKIRTEKNHPLTNFPFLETEDIMKLLSGKSEMYSEIPSNLLPFTTSYSDGRLNLNTASKEILGLFFTNKNDLLFFIQTRKDKPLMNLSEMEYMKQDYLQHNMPFSNLPFTIKSNYFTIISKASSENESVALKTVYKIHEGEPQQIYLEKMTGRKVKER